MKYKLRSIYIAPKDHVLISADLSQAETWVVAFLANELGMKDALLNGDIHSRTAGLFYNKRESEIISIKDTPEGFIMRYAGKKGNHSLSYRTSPPMLQRSYNENSDKPPYLTITINEATRFYNLWHSYYKGIKPWWLDIEAALKVNRTLITPYNRVRRFFNYWGDDLFKEATAFIPQSTVADHTLGRIQPELNIPGGLYNIWLQTKLKIKIIQTAYDSLIAEVPIGLEKEIAEICHTNLYRPIIIRDKECKIPVDITIGDRWSDMKKFKFN